MLIEIICLNNFSFNNLSSRVDDDFVFQLRINNINDQQGVICNSNNDVFRDWVNKMNISQIKTLMTQHTTIEDKFRTINDFWWNNEEESCKKDDIKMLQIFIFLRLRYSFDFDNTCWCHRRWDLLKRLFLLRTSWRWLLRKSRSLHRLRQRCTIFKCEFRLRFWLLHATSFFQRVSFLRWVELVRHFNYKRVFKEEEKVWIRIHYWILFRRERRT